MTVLGKTRGGRYPVVVKERAVRLVGESVGEYRSEWAAIRAVAVKVGVTPETLRVWVRKAGVSNTQKEGVSIESQRILELEREVRELRRVNEILKAASAFFTQELSQNPPRSR